MPRCASTLFVKVKQSSGIELHHNSMQSGFIPEDATVNKPPYISVQLQCFFSGS